jgi:hypothetical protein
MSESWTNEGHSNSGKSRNLKSKIQKSGKFSDGNCLSHLLEIYLCKFLYDGEPRLRFRHGVGLYVPSSAREIHHEMEAFLKAFSTTVFIKTFWKKISQKFLFNRPDFSCIILIKWKIRRNVTEKWPPVYIFVEPKNTRFFYEQEN